MFRNIYKNVNFNHFCYKTSQNEQKKAIFLKLNTLYIHKRYLYKRGIS